jgi:hypothetical protein
MLVVSSLGSECGILNDQILPSHAIYDRMSTDHAVMTVSSHRGTLGSLLADKGDFPSALSDPESANSRQQPACVGNRTAQRFDLVG